MKITRDRKTYDAVAKGEPLVIRRKGRKITIETPTVVTLASGEIQERGTWEYRAGCPVRLGGIVTLRFRDGGLARGRLAVMVTDIERQGDWWMIRLERAGTHHRPIPADDRNHFLAPKSGYTLNANRAIDEMPSMDYQPQARERKPTRKIEPMAAPATDEERAERMAAIEDELAA